MLDFLTLTDFLVVLAIAGIGVIVGLAVMWTKKSAKDGDDPG